MSVTNILLFQNTQKVSINTVFGDQWRNQLRQWLEEGCDKPVHGVCFQCSFGSVHDHSTRSTIASFLPKETAVCADQLVLWTKNLTSARGDGGFHGLSGTVDQNLTSAIGEGGLHRPSGTVDRKPDVSYRRWRFVQTIWHCGPKP